MSKEKQLVFLKREWLMAGLFLSAIFSMVLIFAGGCKSQTDHNEQCTEGQYLCKDNKLYECRWNIVTELLWEEVENCNSKKNYTCVIDKDGQGACVPSYPDGGLPDGGGKDAGADGGLPDGGGIDAGIDGGATPVWTAATPDAGFPARYTPTPAWYLTGACG